MDTSTAAAGAGLRGARALVLAAITLLTSVYAHLAGGGQAPGLGALVVLLAALALVTAPLLRQPVSARRIMLLLLAGQALLHVTLTMSTHATTALAGPTAGPMADMGSAAHLHLGMDPLSSVLVPTTGAHVLMAEGHLLATLVLGLWLAAGERALWRLLTLTVRPVATALAALLFPAPIGYVGHVDAPRRGDVVVGRAAVRLRAPICRAVTRRGPPTRALLASAA